MKTLTKALIGAYQIISTSISPLPACRFRPTCSQYAMEAIEKYGTVKGLVLAIRRVASCHPFSKRAVYDPV